MNKNPAGTIVGAGIIGIILPSSRGRYHSYPSSRESVTVILGARYAGDGWGMDRDGRRLRWVYLAKGRNISPKTQKTTITMQFGRLNVQ